MNFNKEFLNKNEILNSKEQKKLEEISSNFLFDDFLHPRNIEELSVDFAYANSKIEGGTYTYKEAETLILSGKTASNKPLADALMVQNLNNCYRFILENINDLEIDEHFIKNIHKMAMLGILQEKELGNTRQIAVRIGASSYIPETDRFILEDRLKQIVSTSKEYANSFEKSIYLHNNLAYLQYFTDGNKRVSRLVQTASLTKSKKIPFFFLDKNINMYKKSLVSYYETGNYKEYKTFFIKNYEKNLDKKLMFLKSKKHKGLNR